MVERGERAYEKWGRLALFFTPAIVSGTAKMQQRQFVLWNLIASLGFALSVTASAYGVGRLATGHQTWRDMLILIVGLATGAIIVAAFVRRHKRSRAKATRPAPMGVRNNPGGGSSGNRSMGRGCIEQSAALPIVFVDVAD